ncbi:MAG: UDP-N-acetylglucosamine 2-epimerase (non-hydrolyzing) [Crocinitomicaceae bacterium]|nr:UDP-N-acetylglucosamine 2-epimerase (non-hydrolyzing) [Crocinitomicaceae bacterium]
MKKKILIVVGTRPNFIKITRFKDIAHQHYPNLEIKIVHTGQHFNYEMADVFFQQLHIQPDFFLEIPPTSPATQMGEIMIRLEKLIDETFYPDLMIVPGDVNSTFAAALTANKKGILLAHLESGLRSFDRNMPEEINRILTDEITDHYFITEPSGVENLTKENANGKMHFVGNTMIDTLVHFDTNIRNNQIASELALVNDPFILMTIHRPSNVDAESDLKKLIQLIEDVSSRYKIVFPVHPRTIQRLEKFNLKDRFEAISNLIITESMGYFEFQNLVLNASLIITDSGGIQEESTFRQVPSLTLRQNTERPVTVDSGTNQLVTFSVKEILSLIDQIEQGSYKKGSIPEKWDGKATERILKIISNIL